MLNKLLKVDSQGNHTIKITFKLSCVYCVKILFLNNLTSSKIKSILQFFAKCSLPTSFISEYFTNKK